MRNKLTIILCILIFAALLSGCSRKATIQTDMPVSGDKTALIKLSNGDVISIRLFEKEAPNTVKHFISLAQSGAYNGKSISMIVPGYMVRTGEAYDSSVQSEPISIETSDSLKPIRGAVCMDLNGEGVNSQSSFFILTGEGSAIDNLEELLEYKDIDLYSYLKYGYGKVFSEEELDKYRKLGGAPWLEGHHTVFGQVYSGMNYVDILNDVEVSRDGYYTPVTDIVIESIDIYIAE